MNMFPPAQTKAVCTLENNPRQPSDCAIYIFMKIDDDESILESGTVYSKNEQIYLTQFEEYGMVMENENGQDIDGQTDENAMVDVETTYSVRVATGSSVVGNIRSGVKGCDMANIREQWLVDFGTTKVQHSHFPSLLSCKSV